MFEKFFFLFDDTITPSMYMALVPTPSPPPQLDEPLARKQTVIRTSRVIAKLSVIIIIIKVLQIWIKQAPNVTRSFFGNSRR